MQSTESQQEVVRENKASRLSRIRILLFLGAFLCLGFGLLLMRAGEWANILFGSLFGIFGIAWLAVWIWQGFFHLMRSKKTYWETLCLPHVQRLLQYTLFLVLASAPFFLLFQAYVATFVPRLCRMGGYYAYPHINPGTPMIRGIVIANIFLHHHVYLWFPFGLLAIFCEWKFTEKIRRRLRLTVMPMLILAIWGFSLWMLFESTRYGYQVASGFFGQNSKSQAALMEVNLLSQLNPEFQEIQNRLRKYRQLPPGEKRKMETTNLSDEDLRYQVRFLTMIISMSPEAQTQSRAAATLISLGEQIEEDYYLASEVLAAIHKATGQNFQTLSEGKKWLEQKAGDPAWEPMRLMHCH